MSRKNRPTKPVIACSFDAMTFRQQTDLTMYGPFLSARQHRQWWICTVDIHTREDDKDVVITQTICPSGMLHIGAVAKFVKEAILEAGFHQAYKVMVYAKVVDRRAVERQLAKFRGIPEDNVEEVIYI